MTSESGNGVFSGSAFQAFLGSSTSIHHQFVADLNFTSCFTLGTNHGRGLSMTPGTSGPKWKMQISPPLLQYHKYKNDAPIPALLFPAPNTCV
eukprot:762622-Amphidinium_carterae.3